MIKESEVVVKKEPIQFEEDPSFSVIVPVYKVPKDVFVRCLRSIQEQNYDKLEVILVFDGPDDELLDIASRFKNKNPHWILTEIPHGGACKARNSGFNISTGEIVSFINSDYILKPGIIRLWVDKLTENPDCGFIYGAYQYTSSNAWWYPGKEFDPWLLEVANYIDCGFPLWRKYVEPWDDQVKSLQDWDFWLSVIKKHNIKGYYLDRDISYLAEPPREKGLSMDSQANWIKRVRYIKNKHQIPEREVVVTSLGAPNHGISIAKMLKADYRDDTIHKPNEYKGVYMIGFYLKPDQKSNDHGPILSSFKEGVVKIVHWVGADIYWLRKFSYENLKALGGALKLSAIHLVENEQAQKELKELLNLESQVVPIPPVNDYESKPLPDQFSVSLFLTDKSDFDKYLKEHTLSIVRACPDIQFTAYGDGAKDIHYPNLKCYGTLNKSAWKDYVYSNSCYLRIVRHDTAPLASAEFMMAGRRVISNIPGECTDLIDTSGDSEVNKWDIFGPGFNAYRWPQTKKKLVQKIREIKKSSSLIDNFSVKTRYEKEKYVKTIYGLFNLEAPK